MAADVENPIETVIAEHVPTLAIEGEIAALGPLSRDLLPVYHQWNNSLDVIRGQAREELLTLEHIEEWYEQVTDRSSDDAYFTIYERDDMRPVGRTALKKIDHRHGTATFSIYVADGRGRGVGTEATRLTLDWAFNHLGLVNVMLEVDGWNERAVRAYEKAGFQVIGPRRAATFNMGERHDELLMDITADDFRDLPWEGPVADFDALLTTS
ncbi:MAG: GNAT family N-acetyltransferase [Thermoleophilia bacterium]|nr:GNAT family N-acetyltransferase [Thermoleophilia bacterium]